ncbi:DinB family protein [Paenibacillus methanolicus]|uniref:DinB family protein n=1 Tax=Paenibacillus methanolicus TaxID=582686 RepID=A0A5S5C3Q9_9BACL|nr:DinB family protein [Paenibacillus methanolicus]TYP74065.1 DinB family protein [Paenibacillus methanolicus]
MSFKLNEAVEILERTPAMLSSLLAGLSDGWLQANEGEETWNAVEVLLHLIEADRTNWLPRLEVILQDGEAGAFPPFDRFAHLNGRKGETSELGGLPAEFAELRHRCLERLRQLIASEELLERTGTHPAFGPVKARELIATWTVHDLTHAAQIARVLAKRYHTDVGPWKAYLSILK